MSHADDVVTAASMYLKVPVQAAAIFGLADDRGQVAASAVGGGFLADAILPDVPLAGAVGAAAGIHAARQHRATEEGLEVRMVLAVTTDDFHLLDWHEGRCRKEFVRFPRATTHVQITKFGLSRTVEFADPTNGTEIKVTGSTSFLSVESGADKKVLELLAGEAA